MEWISVNDELPNADGYYLTYWTDGSIESYKADEESPVDKIGGYSFDAVMVRGVIQAVTHWMPLPEPPKESE